MTLWQVSGVIWQIYTAFANIYAKSWNTDVLLRPTALTDLDVDYIWSSLVDI